MCVSQKRNGIVKNVNAVSRWGGGSDKDGTSGQYVLVEGDIVKEHEGEDQGLSGHCQLGTADPDVAEMDRHVGVGVRWQGAVHGRDDDVIGLGMSWVHLGRRAGFDEPSETALELFSRAQITPWLAVQPDLQWIHDPRGDRTLRDAWVGAIVLEVLF